MLEVSREEFEEKIQDLIDGKTTRKKLIKELETDSRTLNNKIREMSEYNPELYSSFITKHPYRTKERNDLDYEALVIEIIQTGMTRLEAAQKYGVGERTIERRVKKLEKENPYLVEIYRQVKENNRYKSKPTQELQLQIDELVPRPVVICAINGQKKKELEEFEKIYNERCLTMSKEEAARSMGIHREQIFKMMNQLRRLRSEDEAKSFKERLKIETAHTETQIIKEKTENHKQNINEGEEK